MRPAQRWNWKIWSAETAEAERRQPAGGCPPGERSEATEMTKRPPSPFWTSSSPVPETYERLFALTQKDEAPSPIPALQGARDAPRCVMKMKSLLFSAAAAGALCFWAVPFLTNAS